ncbi:hypothetical protein HK104_007736 [Borealophlyctis nickersoniae]|nr:hypothetical protein HK104_007736 [Borealophlyctis nickersoniae]
MLEPANPVLNMAFEKIAFDRWEKPNFRDKKTNKPLETWPVVGWNYDVLIGGLYPNTKPLWDLGTDGYTFELAVPITHATALLKRVRQLFDIEALHLKPFAATYVSGINIKFAGPADNFLAQATAKGNPGEDWSKGAIMFDMASFRPSNGKRFNEPFYAKLAETIIREFPARPHYTKNTREIYTKAKGWLNQEYVQRFRAVKQKFDPNHVFDSVLGQMLGLQ